jgi:peptide/nickel transport system substrate-binding protein
MFIESMEAPDDRTFIIHVKDTGLVPDWHDGVLGPTAYQAVHMWSKKHFDEKGYDVAVNTAVGTGPFKVVEWVSDSHITLEPAFANHWRRTPNIARLTNREMQEASVILAALKTGEVHIGRIPLKFLGSTLKAIPGARTQQLGVPNLQTFIFGGNYWSTTDPATGKIEDAHGPINARKGYKPDADHPWIGEWGNDASMENARKVREAMSIAIDRSTIVDKIQSGVGFPYYTNMNSHPGDAAWKDEWKISYNPERAKALLAEAGYPNGFSFTTHVAPDREWAPEVGIAVAQYWREIGLDVEVDSTTYLTARPKLVERSKDNPWMIHSGTGQKLHAAGVFHCCHKPTGGFSFGIEIPDEIWQIAALNNDITKTTEEERIANNQKIQDFFSSNFLTAPVAGLPNTAIVRPEIAEWTPYMSQTPLFNSPETITVARR